MLSSTLAPSSGDPFATGACAVEFSERNLQVLVYDFFSGCGGTSSGLKRAGMSPVLALDFDSEAARTYRLNFPGTKFVCEDVRRIQTSDLERYFERERTTPVLISACAPCQPFSRQNRQKRDSDSRITLLSELHRFVVRFRPELLLIENVPGLELGEAGKERPFSELVKLLNRLGYHHDCSVLRALDYGVPQNRRRLFLVASAFGPISLPQPTHGTMENPYPTVRDAIQRFPAIAAGEAHREVKNHQACSLSLTNLARIRATPEGAGRLGWDDSLKLACHQLVKGYSDVYGRMRWDGPAPAMTTRCNSLSNGRFGHPEQDRAISIREAAALQTFDDEFEFTGSLNGMARQIGNAVPVELAHVVGRSLIDHLGHYLTTANG